MSNKFDIERNKDVFWAAENNEIHIFRLYLDELDSFISQEIEKYLAGSDNAKQPIWQTIEDQEFFGVDIEDLYHHEYYLSMYENFRNLFLKSFIMNLYTFLESSLANRCRAVERNHTYSLSVKDLSGNGLNQYMNYLIKLHRIDYSLEHSLEWVEIQNLRRLRNCIAHNGGNLTEGTDQLRQLQEYVKNEPLIKVGDDANNILLSKQFCEKAILTLERFLYSIDRAIDAVALRSHGLY